jgi:bamHI control element
MKTLRARDNISQKDFADLCGLHRTYISDIERCNRNISIDNIERIANAFNVTASDLLKENFKC